MRTDRRRRWYLALLGLALIRPAAAAGEGGAARSPAERAFVAVKHDRARLHAFLRDLPKGGLLHAHLSGEIDPDLLVDLAARGGYYVRGDGDDLGRIGLRRDSTFKIIAPATYEQLDGAGRGHFARLSDWLGADGAGRARLRAQLTVHPGEPPAKFFGEVFDRIDEPGKAEAFQPAYLRDVVERAHRQAISYLELRINPVLALRPGCVESFGRLVEECNRRWPTEEAVTVRFLVGVPRGGATTAADLSAAYRAVAEDDEGSDLLVGVDLVGREDAAGAPARYLAAIRALAAEYPQVPLTLHAGESNERDTHVRDAILLGARRIGHGTNLALDQPDTMRLARDNGVLIEVSLISNRVLLSKPIDEHPFWTYLNCGLPVSLNTDDGGVFDSTLTDEFTEAVLAFDLGWDQVRLLCEQSLAHGFARPRDREAARARWAARWRRFEACPGR